MNYLAQYGESCESPTDKCDGGASLICKNGTCGCNSTTSVYNFLKETCILLVGMPCDKDQENPSCFPNSECTNGVCACLHQDFFQNSKAECVRKSGFGGKCEDDEECSSPFICKSDGYCGCHKTTPNYDKWDKNCVAVTALDEKCHFFSGRCGENSWCKFKNDDSYAKFFSDRDSYCLCRPGYFKNSSDQCEPQRGFGERCDNNEACNKYDEFKCGKNGTCICAKPWMVYDALNKKCVVLEGSPCRSYEFLGRNKQNCVDGANCDSQGETMMVCRCGKGSFRSPNGACWQDHGKWCGDDWTNKCDERKGLVCKQGVCECEFDNFKLFDKKSGECKTLVYGGCSNTTECVKNAYCSENKVCLCDQGFSEAKGKCYLSMGQVCTYDANSKKADYLNVDAHSAGSKCDPLALLKCIKGTCQCNHGEFYDELHKRCVGLKGSLCDTGDLGYCTLGLRCMPIGSLREGSGICTFL
ncbi:unnamed protein product [Orchesella dallaii]|uniref:Tenascin-X n=1 Tax=Orchesella dallaii TaxID=48710 RepID=A0ABP1S4J2_9HEXA